MKDLYKEFEREYRSGGNLDNTIIELNCRLNFYYQNGLITETQAVAIADAFGLDYPW